MKGENMWEPVEDYSQWIDGSKDMIDWYRSAGHNNRKYRKPRTPEQLQHDREQRRRYEAEHHNQLRARQRERHRQRMATDPEYAARKQAAARQWYQNNRQRILEQHRHPEPQPRVEPGLSLTEQRAAERRKARHRERMADPEYVGRRRAYTREHYRKQRAKTLAERERINLKKESEFQQVPTGQVLGNQPETTTEGEEEADLVRGRTGRKPAEWSGGSEFRKEKDKPVSEAAIKKRQRAAYREPRKRKPKTREQKDRYNVKLRERMQTDPEYAARRRQAMHERYERRKHDPDYIERNRQANRAYKQRQRAATQAARDQPQKTGRGPAKKGYPHR
jgi:hypothetical protein